MVDTIFSSASKQFERAAFMKKASKDETRPAEEREFLKEYSKETEKRAKSIEKLKEKSKEKFKKKVEKLLKTKLKSKKILKPSQMTITIKKTEPHSILGEENKFFKSIMEQEKRSMFFD